MTWVIGSLLVAAVIALWWWNRRLQAQDPVHAPLQRLESAQSAQQFVGWETIADDVIRIDSYRLRAVIEVQPVNWYLLSQGDQRAALAAFKEVLDSLRGPLQIYVPSFRTDHRPKMRRLLESLEDGDPRLRTYAAEISEMVEQWTRYYTPLQKRFFLIAVYNYEPPPTGRDILDEAGRYRQGLAELHTRCDLLLEGLARAGLKAHRLTTAELAFFLFSVYNRDRAKAIDISQIESAGVMTLFATADVSQFAPRPPAPPPAESTAPDTIIVARPRPPRDAAATSEGA